MTTLKCTAALPISPVCLASAGSAPNICRHGFHSAVARPCGMSWPPTSASSRLLAAHTGSRSYLVATERIDSMSALAGRKAHVAGLARDVARGLGLEPVSIAPGQLSGALQRGEILAAECGGAIISYALGLHAAAAYWAGTSIHRNGTALSLAIRRDLWERLPGSEQAALTAAAAAEYQLSLAEEEAHRHMLFPEPRGGAHLAARCRVVARHPPRRRCGGSACRRRRRPNTAYQRQLRRLPAIRAGRHGHPGGLTTVSFWGACP